MLLKVILCLFLEIQLSEESDVESEDIDLDLLSFEDS